MDDQVFFEQFHRAYDFEPRAGSFERLRSKLARSEARLQRRSKFGLRRLAPHSMRLLAAAVLLALAVAATGAFMAIQQYAHRTIPVVPPPIVGPSTGGCAANQLLAYDALVCSADDFAVRGQSQALAQQAGPTAFDEVFITHDAGRTWLSVKVPCCFSDTPQIAVRWINSQNLVIVYGSHLIEVTTDGGTHWQVIRSTWTGGQNLPFFLNASEGWQYGAAGLFHTTDGGATWTAVSSFPSSNCCDWWAERLIFIDSQDGFIRPGGSGQLYVTRDGGHTWSPGVLSPKPPDSQFGNVPQGPFVFGKSGLMAFFNKGDSQGGGTTLSVYKTSDGGLTWSGPRSAPGLWLSALDMTLWWTLDDTGRLSRTSDGGQSWQRIQTNLANGMVLTSVTPVGGNVLWGVARNGYVAKSLPGGGVKNYPNLVTVRSTDGGTTWSIVKVPA